MSDEATLEVVIHLEDKNDPATLGYYKLSELPHRQIQFIRKVGNVENIVYNLVSEAYRGNRDES